MSIEPDMIYNELKTKWSWKTSSGRVWKCECVHCGATYYIREYGLQSGLAPKCICQEKELT